MDRITVISLTSQGGTFSPFCGNTLQYRERERETRTTTKKKGGGREASPD